MTDSTPLVRNYKATVAAVSAGSDKEANIVDVEFAGTVTAVTYVPDTVLTGADTNSRTLVLVNKGQSGSGTTVIATKAFTASVNAAADDETAITLSAVAHATEVAAGDILAWQSTHVGTGLADPGGMAVVGITRS